MQYFQVALISHVTTSTSASTWATSVTLKCRCDTIGAQDFYWAVAHRFAGAGNLFELTVLFKGAIGTCPALLASARATGG